MTDPIPLLLLAGVLLVAGSLLASFVVFDRWFHWEPANRYPPRWFYHKASGRWYRWSGNPGILLRLSPDEE